MSIIGTRPPLISETNFYELHHRARLAIKPGITGMWQVSGRSDITDFEEVVRLDKEYITNWNIGLDIKILFKTILVGDDVAIGSHALLWTTRANIIIKEKVRSMGGKRIILSEICLQHGGEHIKGFLVK